MHPAARRASPARHRLEDPVTLRLRDAGAGDHDAFAELYDLMASRVHGLVLRVVRDHHHAEEVTQEVFVEIWRNAARFDPLRGSAQGWMLAMAHHRAVDGSGRSAPHSAGTPPGTTSRTAPRPSTRRPASPPRV